MGPLMIGVPKRNDKYLKDSKHGFFCGNCFPSSDKKKGLVNPTKGFLRFFFLIRHISKKKG
jgi:hypothetical protein